MCAQVGDSRRATECKLVDLPDALDHLARGRLGKIVLKIDGEAWCVPVQTARQTMI
jgi:hypothetical protein